ncbi:hypothetical protein FGO68_gene17002 [Halteria grandinella]|uniref:Cyclin-like domain-containing protein n=1 Tax=Halteria grandinella TaxID=5974 RepID=A0A8J8NV58_HALGN|nr:hypothetical protein FGO68_gene17002 [Halteria grandinella]
MLFLKNTRRSLGVVENDKTYLIKKANFNPARNPTTPQKPLESPRFSTDQHAAVNTVRGMIQKQKNVPNPIVPSNVIAQPMSARNLKVCASDHINMGSKRRFSAAIHQNSLKERMKGILQQSTNRALGAESGTQAFDKHLTHQFGNNNHLLTLQQQYREEPDQISIFEPVAQQRFSTFTKRKLTFKGTGEVSLKMAAAHPYQQFMNQHYSLSTKHATAKTFSIPPCGSDSQVSLGIASTNAATTITNSGQCSGEIKSEIPEQKILFNTFQISNKIPEEPIIITPGTQKISSHRYKKVRFDECNEKANQSLCDTFRGKFPFSGGVVKMSGGEEQIIGGSFSLSVRRRPSIKFNCWTKLESGSSSINQSPCQYSHKSKDYQSEAMLAYHQLGQPDVDRLAKWMRKVFNTFYGAKGDILETESLASSLAFRYLHALWSNKCGGYSTSKIPLLGMACVIIASKYCETNAISVQELLKRTGNKFTYHEFMNMERSVLATLKWKVRE